MHKKETAVLRTYGTELSLSKRNKIRMIECFETKAQCNERNKINMEKIATGKKRKKDHVGSSWTWNKDECISVLNSYPDGHNLNFSELARLSNVRGKNDGVPLNGGQILSKILKLDNIDLSRFANKTENCTPWLRRKKIIIEGAGLSIPCDVTNDELKEDLERMIDEGKYNIGELIVPQTFQKIIITDDGETQMRDYTVAGRKIPFQFRGLLELKFF